MMSRCEELIAKYHLTPHPEGGWYKETYRCPTTLQSPVNGEVRNSVTQIYFLLTEGDISRFHKVEHDEIWHFYEGSPLRLLDLHDNLCSEILLGRINGNYHHVIPGGHYQAAQSTGEYTLVGCTVAPGFDFHDFQFLKDDKPKMKIFEPHSENYRCFI